MASAIIVAVLQGLIVAYLPGALIFRAPVADRSRRAALAADERLFWQVLLSVAWSLALVLAMAAFAAYRFDRLIATNLAASLLIVVTYRRRLAWHGTASRLRWSAVLPLALIALGVWRFFPSSEYVIGGKDPGVYVNEGVELARRGDIVMHEAVVAGVPPEARDLFFPSHQREEYYSTRFMGFFLMNPDTGEVVGQFPHLYPASIAIGYGLAGLTGARSTIGVWGIAGLVAVFFLGARIFGRAVAFAAAALLSLHVAEVFFARYPNTELVMQALLAAAVLAYARAHQDDDRFFSWIAGTLLALLIFLRVDALLAVAAIGAAAVLIWVVDRRTPAAGLVITLVPGSVLGWMYLSGPMRAYFWRPLVYLQNLPAAAVMAGALGAITALVALNWLRQRMAASIRWAVPIAGAMALLILAAYALFLRHPGGRLADYDAYAFQTFTRVYFFWPGLLVAAVGLVIACRRNFWKDPAFFAVFAAFAVFFFYKIQVVPEHFWLARRFLPVILPGAFLLMATAALGPPERRTTRARLRALAGVIVLAALGRQYDVAARPVMDHVEYKGAVRYLERLSSHFTDRDLVLFESRNSGDTHILAPPLAYVYGRQVLVLVSPRPERPQFEAFLKDALIRYDRVFIVASYGEDLLSRRIVATPIANARQPLPEYEPRPWNESPGQPGLKTFDYAVFQLQLGTPHEGPFTLDVGSHDELNVLRFFPKDTLEGRSIRWTGPQSFVAVPNLSGAEREVALDMHDGYRSPSAPPADVQVFFDDVRLGQVTVGPGFQTYRLPIPAALVERAAARDDPAQLRLVSTVWTPAEFGRGTDVRSLGVVVGRIEIH